MLFINSINVCNQTQNIIYDRITYKDGLNQSSITTIFQDHKGFIWIGSYGGLQRYDGYEMVDYDQVRGVGIMAITEDSRGLLWISTARGIFVFNPENGKFLNFYPLPTGFIYEAIEDSSGIMWATSAQGLLKMEPKLDQKDRLKEVIFEKGFESGFDFSLYQPNETDPTPGANHLYEIYLDSREQLWIGGGAGLFVFNGTANEFIRMDVDSTGKSRLIYPLIYDMDEENPDVMWVQTYQGFNRISNLKEAFSDTIIDKTDLHFEKYYLFRDYYGGAEGSKFFMDRKNNIWTRGLLSGLIKMSLDENNRAIFEEVISDPLESGGAELGSATAGMVDRTGLLWAGYEYGGIEKFRDENNIFTSKVGMLSDFNILRYSFNQIYEDDDENLWVCSWGNGIFKISKEGKVSNYQLTHNGVLDTLGNATVSILEIEKGIFWVGAANGCWQLDASTGKTQRIVTEVTQTLFTEGSYAWQMRKIDHYVLMSPNRRGLWIYDLKPRKLDKYPIEQKDSLNLNSSIILSLDIMKNGDIWISTSDHGINRLSLNKTTGKLIFLPLPEVITTNSRVLPGASGIIFQIYEDTNGSFWFCTATGLIRLNLQSGEIQKWTEKDGLSSNQINSIAEDNYGNMWLGTAYGLSMLNPETGIIKTFDESNGRPGVKHATGIPSFKNKKGLIYFSGAGGFYSINSDNLYRNDSIPPMVITSFRIFNKPVYVDSTRNAILTKNISYTQEISLKYNQNDLSFTFAALDYNNSAQNKCTYMLEGYQDEWIETDANNRIATYTNLSPGEYTFRVKGSNNDGIWNEEGTFVNIIIHPPFWKTTLAYIAYCVIFILLIWGFIYWRTRRLRNEKIILEKRVSERTKQIEEQKEALIQQKEDLKTANTRLEEQQEELQEVNTLLEEQKEELMQQKEELQVTLENLEKTQEQLVESEKMAAIGGLVAGVAHEMNTPIGIGITAISNLIDDVKNMATLYKKDEISRKDFKEFLESTNNVSQLIQKNLERAASLIQSFKQVSTDQVTEQQRVFALKDYLNDILQSLQPKFRGKNITFNIVCDEELQLNSYPGVYAQIFTNLLLNSLQHGFQRSDAGTVTIKADMDQDLLKIQYSDDGAGISKKDLPHIFEPFYTSDQRRGTGLGLNIIYNLIRQKLHGIITCESEPGEGVLFKIEVPVK
jgi:signal transduction histidine kinase/ligand-binding sensor domain-containing protein